MTYQEFRSFYDKYQLWIGKPIKVSVKEPRSGERSLQLFLLIDIQCTIDTKNPDELIVSRADVLLQNLSSASMIKLSLEEFVLNVKPINLWKASTLRLSRSKKNASVEIGNNHERIAFFMIQLNSHFGRSVREWTEVASNLSVCFSLTQQGDMPLRTEKVLLSTLITDQRQPVFYISQTFAALRSNNDDRNMVKNLIEIHLEEVQAIEEDYEMTLVFVKNE